MILQVCARGKQWQIFYLIDVFVMSSVSEPFGLTALEAAHHDTTVAVVVNLASARF